MIYKSMLSEKEMKERRRWHDKFYNELKNKKSTSPKYLGRKFIVPQNVLPPQKMSKILGKFILMDVRKADRVLDMGTGSGVNAILAASKSSDVVAVDVNPYAIRCAKRNAEFNDMSKRIKFFKGNLFEKVSGKFDLIIFDPPFRWFTPRDTLERSITDKNYAALNAFFRNVKKYLNKNGRVLIFFGTSGDLDYLKYIIKKSRFKINVLCKKEYAINSRYNGRIMSTS